FEQRGGNSWFTDGAIRFAHQGLADVRTVIPEMTDDEAARIDLPPYPAADFQAELMEMSSGRANRELAMLLASDSLGTMRWLRDQSVRFAMLYDNQAFDRAGRHHFWGGLSVKSIGRGIGLVEALFARAEALGVTVAYGCRATAMSRSGSGWRVEVESQLEGSRSIRGGAVILACGGFEANGELRREHLGPTWEDALVRGTEYNRGDGLMMAPTVGGIRAGCWSGCHAIATDAAAPDFGDRQVPGDIYKKHSYPLGIVVNRKGRRFLDEGADFRNYTYAKYGKAILEQPGGLAYQLFDQQVVHLLREEYRRPEATSVIADSIEALATGIGVDPTSLTATVSAYNAAVEDGAFNPERKDGKSTVGVSPPKSNWALRFDQPPFLAYPVRCAITFTFGGVAVDSSGRLLDGDGRPIPGVYAAGEMVGGLFFDNYPGGAGLISGATFGRRSGEHAGQWVR
ncbi:MAG: FAD-dependent tricarballylate dehydrogenase TcuA, partial [Gemmatimonadetes bacterium]|nr:FAD-dependent tricarballylate dehydrogenase TcuA [Gemmatimonadota bacterium]